MIHDIWEADFQYNRVAVRAIELSSAGRDWPSALLGLQCLVQPAQHSQRQAQQIPDCLLGLQCLRHPAHRIPSTRHGKKATALVG